MKRILPALIFVFLLSSCTYQYFTVSSEQLSKNDKNDFVVENDTLKLVYRFNGNHGPVQITIFNKTNEPLEVDWRKSALIMNENAVSYYTPNMVLNGTINQDSLKKLYFLGSRYSNANIHADILVNEPSQFIPPRSSISKIPLALPQKSLVLLSENLKKEKLKVSEYTDIKVVQQQYGSERSPVNFRSYLTFIYGTGKEFSVENNFYVSQIMQTVHGPGSIPQAMQNGDVFYVSGNR
jgi:hypothetical protein